MTYDVTSGDMLHGADYGNIVVVIDVVECLIEHGNAGITCYITYMCMIMQPYVTGCGPQLSTVYTLIYVYLQTTAAHQLTCIPSAYR